jgi:hypothetical protein
MTVWAFQYVCSSHVLNCANKRGHSEAIVADTKYCTVLPGWRFLVISQVISIASEDSRTAVRVARGGRGRKASLDAPGEQCSRCGTPSSTLRILDPLACAAHIWGVCTPMMPISHVQYWHGMHTCCNLRERECSLPLPAPPCSSLLASCAELFAHVAAARQPVTASARATTVGRCGQDK